MTMMMDAPTPQSPSSPVHDAIDGETHAAASPEGPPRPRQFLPLSPTQDTLLARAAVGGGSADTLAHDPRDTASAALTTFMKYGAIRPPVSVLQDEFLDRYGAWQEHAAPLAGLDGGNGGGAAAGGDGAGEAWMGCMTRVRKLHARHHRPRHCPPPLRQEGYANESDLFGRWSGEKSKDAKAAADCEQKCDEDERKATVDDLGGGAAAAEGERSVDATDLVRGAASAGHGDEQQRLEKLAALMFRPGAKLAGSVEQRQEKSLTNRYTYELVLMEADAMDETGQRPRGMLARHKFAGDEQCIFVNLSVVPVPASKKAARGETKEEEEEEEEEKVSIAEEEVVSKKATASSCGGGSGGKSGCGASDEETLTIQMEYVDGNNRMHGLWNHKELRFEGAVEKIIEGQGDQTQIGGTIVNSLISGHSGYNDGYNGGYNDGYDDGDDLGIQRRERSFSSSPSNNSTTGTRRTFMLSPCSHLHPHGIAPAALSNRCTMPETPSRRVQSSETTAAPAATGGSNSLSSLRNKGKGLPAETIPASPSNNDKSRTSPTPAQRQALLDALASPDNDTLVLHRARTDALRGETLAKLVELGNVLDFAELARQRNVAARRAKWRGRARRLTPLVPLLRALARLRPPAAEARALAKRRRQEPAPRTAKFYERLAAIAWGDLLEEAGVQAERTCAAFRRKTSLLEALTFASDEYKAQVMADLRVHGLTLAAAHSEWDTCIQNGRVVALGWSWFERGSWSCFERSAVVGRRCVYLLFQMHERLEGSHKHLEQAYRGADARLTVADLERIRTQGGDGALDEADKLCGICQCDMDEGADDGHDGGEKEGNPAVCLPCGHSFHWECIREWLHNNAQCPICRVDLHARDTPADKSL